MTIRGVFVDRDGTINVEKDYVFRIEEFEFIPGALRALARLTERDIPTYIITNQAGIAKGLYSEREFRILTEQMLAQMTKHGIEIADVLFCPHHPEGTVAEYRKACECRKPGTELLRGVIDASGHPAAQFALIGDKSTDIEAGRRCGVRTYLVETGYGAMEKMQSFADHVVPDLEAAVSHLLEEEDRGARLGSTIAEARR